jgi:polyisoprenoid-binding protein YceI
MMRPWTNPVRSVAIAGTVMLLSFHASAATSTWQLDPSRSSAEFSVRYLAVSHLRGSLPKAHGTATLDDQDATKSTLEITIDVANLNTREVGRDEELRSDRIFDVAHYPTMIFKSKKVELIGVGALRVTGDLTIRGVTKEVVFSLIGPSAPHPDPDKVGRRWSEATATTTIRRQDFGIKNDSTMNSGAAVAGNEVSVTLHLEMVQQSPAK